MHHPVVRRLPALALAALAAACSDPPPPAAPAPVDQATVPAVPVPAASAPAAGDDERRVAAMRERFAELERLQKDARGRFHDLGYRAGRTQVAPARARELNDLLQQAGYRLQMPKGLGAFSDVAGIEQEIAALQDVETLLDQAAALLEPAATPAP